MRSYCSFRIHHVLQINLIEAVYDNNEYNDPANNYDIKPECATERVDDNLWNIIFTTSSLQELKCNTHQASTWQNRSFSSHWRQHWRWSWCQPWCRKRSEFSWGRIVHCCGQSWRWRRWELWTQDPSTPSAPGSGCWEGPKLRSYLCSFYLIFWWYEIMKLY